MKKIFLLAAVALVAFTACTKIEDTDATPARKITFQAASYLQQTKAEVSIMSEFTSFKCKAFLHAAGYTDETQNMFTAEGETISAYTSGNAVTTTSSEVSYWAPSHDYYWPKDPTSYINFVGWYDKKGTAPTSSSETLLKWENYSVLTTANLLFADEAWHYKANPTTGYHLDGSVSEGVPMLFHHALAQLCIQAKVTKASEGNTSWDVTLEDISLAGVFNQGTLTLSNTEPSGTTPATQPWTGSWVPSGTAGSVSMSDVTTPLTTTAVDVLTMQNVLPQTVTNNVVLNFKYNISYKYNGSEYAHEKITASVQLNSITDAITSWDMNKKITYTITINPETTIIRIDPAMVDWEEVAGGSTTL